MDKEKTMTLHLMDEMMARVAASLIKYALMILLSPIFFMLAVFYMILHSSRTPSRASTGPPGDDSGNS